MSECEKCHGEGTIPCPTCKGKKTEPCKKCEGTGKVTCNNCDGDGVVRCGECYGTGKKVCPVCYKGKVKKTRWINCADCHGTGQESTGWTKCNDCGELQPEASHPAGSLCDLRNVFAHRRCHGTYQARMRPCSRCEGRGQVEETYYEICPNCHGDYANYSKEVCSKCNGTGRLVCGSCHGEKTVKCGNCDGAGHVTCSHCKGEGKEKCPDCEKREREAKEKREREEREAKERRERKEREERNRRIAAQEKKEAEEKAAKERRDTCVGCGCLLAIIAIVGFLIWWWIEGMTMAALPGMWTQAKNAVGEAGGIAKVAGGIVALFIVWKLISALKRKKGTAEVSTSTKKRWKFVVLGLLFGFLGAHLAYAKRWTLFLLLWAGLVTGGSFATSSSAAKSTTDATAQAQQTEQSKSNDNTISNIGFALWGLLWIGGTLFIKKDAKGNRM